MSLELSLCKKVTLTPQAEIGRTLPEVDMYQHYSIFRFYGGEEAYHRTTSTSPQIVGTKLQREVILGLRTCCGS
ncbi:hypothetical protein BFC21_12915 [Pseudomonas sp. TMW 2.1634]|nr:hypothetical protein BFC21_12915 [Pseudomonas sp. TMW 2.1634]